MRCRRRSSSPFYQNINSQQISLCSEFWHTCILNINTWQRFFFQFRLRFCHLGCFDNKDGRPLFLAARILNHYSTDNVGLTLFCWRFFPTENEKICEGRLGLRLLWSLLWGGCIFHFGSMDFLPFYPLFDSNFFHSSFFQKVSNGFLGKEWEELVEPFVFPARGRILCTVVLWVVH